MYKLLRNLLITTLFATTTLSHASDSLATDDKKCEFTSTNFVFTTPQWDDIATAYWQEGKVGYEVFKKLFIIHNNGDIAIITHQYCWLYKFTVTYIPSENKKPNSFTDIFSPIDRYRAMAVRTDATTEQVVARLKQDIESKFDNLDTEINRGSDAISEENNFMGYSIGYRPLPYSFDLGGEITYSMSLNQTID